MDLSKWTIPVLATLCAVLAPLLGLERDPRAPRGVASLVLDLPADVGAVVIVADGARQRLTPAGRALAGMASEAGSFDATAEAWRGLASKLGWSPERAFDELLGRRAVIVLRGLEPPAKLEWALLSEISPEAEERLRRRLGPAPRGISSGLPVLAIESGEYELTISRGQGGSPSTLLLAPAENAALFDQLVPVVAGQAAGATLRSTAGAPLLRRAMGADVVLLTRQGGDAARERPRAFVALWATLRDDRWRAELASSPGVLAPGPDAPAPEIDPWSAKVFRGMARDALFATMGSVGRTAGVPPLPALRGHEGWLAPLVLDPERLGVDDLLGQRSAIFVSPAHRPGCVDEEPLARVTVTVAIETVDARAMAAAGDRMVAAALPLLEGETGGPAVAERVPEYGGAMPGAIRNVPLQGELANTMRRALGPVPVISWGTCEASLPEPREAAAPDAKACPNPGWWVVSVAASDVPAALIAREALAADGGSDAPDARPRVSVGIVRPAALEAWVSRLNPDFLGPLSPMRWVEAVEWDAWAGEDGAIEGALELRMRTDLTPAEW